MSISFSKQYYIKFRLNDLAIIHTNINLHTLASNSTDQNHIFDLQYDENNLYIKHNDIILTIDKSFCKLIYDSSNLNVMYVEFDSSANDIIIELCNDKFFDLYVDFENKEELEHWRKHINNKEKKILKDVEFCLKRNSVFSIARCKQQFIYGFDELDYVVRKLLEV